MLVNLQTIIGMAEKGGYCIPAFNVYNTETVMGVIAAAEEAKAPTIIHKMGGKNTNITIIKVSMPITSPSYQNMPFKFLS